MSKIANAPSKPFDMPIIICSICRDRQTVARSATSYTLKPWRVVSYPNDCHCPRCSGIKKTLSELSEDEIQKPKKPPVKRDNSIIAKYYRVALMLGEFTTSDIKKHDLPNLPRAGAYLWFLKNIGKLKKMGRSKFKIAPEALPAHPPTR